MQSLYLLPEISRIYHETESSVRPWWRALRAIHVQHNSLSEMTAGLLWKNLIKLVWWLINQSLDDDIEHIAAATEMSAERAQTSVRHGGIIGPYFFHDRVHFKLYREMIRNFV